MINKSTTKNTNGDNAKLAQTINGVDHGRRPTQRTSAALNGASSANDVPSCPDPIAICGMACRLPGGISSPQQLWEFLISKGDARSQVPSSRYNAEAYHSTTGKPGTTASLYGYFIGEDLAKIDASFFSMSPTELGRCDPQQRQMLEVARECIEDAGETEWVGRNIGVYMGSFGEDWCDMMDKDPQQYGLYRVSGASDFILSNRVAYEMDLRGPSMNIRTACSASMVALHEACCAISRGDCTGAIVGGSNMIISPGMTQKMTEQGVLSPDASCKTFSADADGYGRAEAINAIYLKPLSAALSDGNPVRAVIRATAANSDGKTPTISYPSADAQETLMRHAYKLAGIQDFSETAFVECHGTGTPVGDPIETSAVARVFGHSGVYIGSVKPNFGHSEGASGITSVIKAVLALENRLIPPNIKFSRPNPNIPFEDGKLTVPTEPIEWPKSCKERVSVNSFGVGGSNAHVILDSASSHNAELELKESTYAPQLLIFSANSRDSLNSMMKNYEDFLVKYPERITDLAYTLANKREKLSHRAFMVASREGPGMRSSISKTANPPKIVMVFTGQGAQWPQMGRDLFRNNFTFTSSIRNLDLHLQNLPEDDRPNWTIETELRKPAKTSRLGIAEISQPLCTAIQIALVDLLGSVGVVPDAVVGHSSGEIAAAYATGALSAEEAIVAAFYRGSIARKQTRAGAMAAIGLGWNAVKEYLVPNVTVACDNSPMSVTLSGDADKVKSVLEDIQKSKPDVLARLLKVDKAYHSHHMTEIGENYQRSIERKVAGRHPSKPFFSSVTGTLLGIDEVTDATYWRKNLESPVMFRRAVSGIISHPIGQNAVYLEIGPHSALAGPLRQILTAHSISAPYLSSMTRGQSGVETTLSVIGELYKLRTAIDFKALIPDGRCLSDLPRYPWDHSKSYWHETRVTKEWRSRQFPQHDLLGIRTLESTDFEPVWRNLFHVDNAPWVRHHKVDDNTVFPLACYIAMAGEAVRQISGIQEGFSVRNFMVHTGLVVGEGKPVELITTFRRQRLTTTLDSQWWEFTIGSHNGHAWTKHGTGEVMALEAQPMRLKENLPSLPRKVDGRRYYSTLRLTGMNYEPDFQVLENVRCSTGAPEISTAMVRNNTKGDEAAYHLHPTILDGALQLLCITPPCGRYRQTRTNLATNIAQLNIFRCSSDIQLKVTGSYTGNGSILGDCQLIGNGLLVGSMMGVKCRRLEESTRRNDTHAAARHIWKKDTDFIDHTRWLKQTFDRKSYMQDLEQLFQLCLVHAHRALGTNLHAMPPHLQKHREWIEGKVSSIDNLADSWLKVEDLLDLVSLRAQRLSNTPAFEAALAMVKVSNSIADIFSGSRDVLDILHEDDVLNKFLYFISEAEISPFLDVISHGNPNLRILELAAGSGSRSKEILEKLVSPEGLILYSKYTFTDFSSAQFDSAGERLKSYPNVEFATLDIGKDLEDQGFEGRQYDLIIASNAIHQTESLSSSLSNVRRLLHPRGHLLLQELCPSSQWINFILGLFPRWWLGSSDNREGQACVDPMRWESELRSAGFEALGGTVLDSEDSSQFNAIMIAKPHIPRGESKRITILGNDNSDSNPIAAELRKRGYKTSRCTIDNVPPSNEPVICLLDQGSPFLHDLTADKFKQLKTFLENVGSFGIFWITPLSSFHCKDPRYGQISGFARTIRSEIGMDFAVCETDVDFGSHLVVDVFEKFLLRKDDADFTPEMEYTIWNGQVHIGRFYPFRLTDDLLESDPDDKIQLCTEKLGRLADLKWAMKPTSVPIRDQVEVEVYSVGLNFRDILVAMGIVELDAPVFGIEAAGVVRRKGPEVKHLDVGDRVMVCGGYAFASIIVESELVCAKIPNELSFTDGATIPCVYGTAFHSLIDIGRLKKGQSVLIHSGCGGVGIAAIQIAKMIGGDIFTTVGSEEKVNYLMKTFSLPRNRIFNSRDASFVDNVMRETKGKGVNLILNSLSGELLHATWRCVAEFGMMVEIGKRDLLGAGKLDMDIFLKNRSYCCVDLDRIRTERPYEITRIFKEVVQLLETGHIQPIRPVTVFNAMEVRNSFTYMQQGKHMGKIVIELRDLAGKTTLASEAIERRLRTTTFDKSASYLLVGGLGGLGRAISVWMVEQGARHLVFLSRGAGTSGKHDEFVRELNSMGCEVRLVRGTVTSLDDVDQAVKASSAPLRGIIQMSMVLRDQGWPKMSWENWNDAVCPKVQGTWNLHNATNAAGLKLDFFVLFSSLSSVVGQVGQANYSSANTFLDAFCRYRTELGLPASAIDIGAVEDVGFIAENKSLFGRMKSLGFYGIKEKDLLDAMAVAVSPLAESPAKTATDGLTNPTSFVLGLASTVPLNSDKNRSLWRRDPRMAVYRNNLNNPGVAVGPAASGNESSSDTANALKSFLAGARSDPSVLLNGENDAGVFLAREIGRKVMELLANPDDEVNTALGLSDLGMDSLVAVEMRQWWKQVFGFDISVLEMLGMGTLDALGKYALEKLIGKGQNE